MKNLAYKLLLIAACVAAPVSAQAESWVFGPSYYSHTPYLPSQRPAAQSRGPFYNQPPGYSVKSGYRNIRGFINVGGQTFEQMNVWESWVQPSSASF
jgi:hypothetical protein